MWHMQGFGQLAFISYNALFSVLLVHINVRTAAWPERWMLNFGKFFTLLASSFLNYSNDQRRRSNEYVKKRFDRFSKKNHNFVQATHFLCISLPSLHDHDVKFSCAMLCGGLRHTRTNFSFAFETWVRPQELNLRNIHRHLTFDSELEWTPQRCQKKKDSFCELILWSFRPCFRRRRESSLFSEGWTFVQTPLGVCKITCGSPLSYTHILLLWALSKEIQYWIYMYKNSLKTTDRQYSHIIRWTYKKIR